ncbi:hypothetical protein GCM10010492_36430 [Saccharothrix mutabilis subsp. mutabilis]|uniref:Uncharacterized protein n=1 Tax=Saccharothrix mutabilis subsp. mutabilis TaxID=66855 RepID=A0ABN0TZL5_9PSEU
MTSPSPPSAPGAIPTPPPTHEYRPLSVPRARIEPGAGGHPSGAADVAGAAATTPPTANATAHNRLDLRLMHTPR